ncbi:MAG: hypothetical protein ACKOX6_18010 [Bdellovibrio sp.]
MRKNLKPQEIDAYFKNWRIEFNHALLLIITKQLGYHRVGKLKFKKTNENNPEQNIKNLKKRKQELTKFQKSFGSLCKKLESLPKGFGSKRPSSEITDSKVNDLKDAITNEINTLRDQLETRQRRRIPAHLAFELARALHFCSGSQNALGVFKNLIEDSNELQKDVEKSIGQIKAELTYWISVQNNANRILLKHSKSTSRKRAITAEIKQLVEARKRILKYKNVFSLIGTNRSQDPRWATRLREHLIRSLLSEGDTRIIKRLSAKKVQKKLILVREMDQRNRETLKG